MQALKFKAILYKTKDIKGSTKVGDAVVDFLESRYKEKQKIKTFNFDKYNKGETLDQKSNNKNQDKFNYDSDNPDNPNDLNPVQYPDIGLSYEFEPEDPITKLNTKKSKNKKKKNENDA